MYLPADFMVSIDTRGCTDVLYDTTLLQINYKDHDWYIKHSINQTKM